MTSTTESPVPGALLSGLAELQRPAAADEYWQQRYREFHAHPELSGQEYDTARRVAEELRRIPGWEVTEGVGTTGVVGVLRGGPGPVVWLRADMDGLPVQEDTGLDYSSTASGVMHACGHDLHVTALLAACVELASDETLIGTVVAVFQPAEETGTGARGMLADGLLDRFPRPRIVLGQHVGPMPAGVIVTRPGPLMAASDSVRVKLFGVGGHGSAPHLSINPLTMAAAVVQRLQELAAQQCALPAQVVLSPGALHVGTRPNIIADSAELLLTLRTFTEGSRERMKADIERVVRAQALVAGAPAEPLVEFYDSFPVTVNTPDDTERVMTELGAAGQVVVPLQSPFTGSEDFGRFGTAAGCPSVFWHIGGTGLESFQPEDESLMLQEGTLPPRIATNHSPRYAPDPAVTLPTAISAMVTAARAELAS